MGCAHNGERLDCGERDTLLHAVFEFQFANNRSAIGQDAAAYFIGLENGQDPEPSLLRRFEGHQPRVEPISNAGRIEHRVTDLNSGRPALIFRIHNVTQTADDTALVEAGYYEAELSSSWSTFQGRCENGEWRIERVGPEILS